VALLIAGFHCKKKDTILPDSLFESPVAIDITGEIPAEVSGIADSQKNPGYCWIEQDSGNPPEIILINHDGRVTRKVYLKGATNVDWEDIATVTIPGSGDKWLLIAETGNNQSDRNEFKIYRFPEPSFSQDTINNYQSIRFSYSDGTYDTEAILSDATGDIFLITKREAKSRIYQLAYPQSLTDLNKAQFLGELPYNGVVSAATSSSGTELLIKTYTQLKYYKRKNGQSMFECLQQMPSELSYQLEPMGEAVTFLANGTGFYTLSEKTGPSPLKMYYYKRK
jgi:hypothetical protein